MTNVPSGSAVSPNKLLAEDEPRPFERFNSDGKAPVLVLCDHATNFVPRDLRTLGLDQTYLSRHIAWDIGIADITRLLARRLDAPALLTHFSRLVIDPNRHLDDPTSVPAVSDDVPIPGNQNLTPAAVKARIETFFDPYHAAVTEALDAIQARGTPPAIVSMHSFTPIMKSVERPWKIGILWNKDPRLAVPLIEKFEALGIPVGDNQPYSGKDGHGYTQHRHADERGLANALIEVRQDLIDTRQGAEEWSAILANVLSEILRGPGIFKVEHYH